MARFQSSVVSRAPAFTFVMLSLVAAGVPTVIPGADGSVATETKGRGGAIRENREGKCASRIVSYLRRAVTQRAELKQRELRARANLNEARSVALEEEDGQREPKNDTHQRIMEAWGVVGAVNDDIIRFNERTIKQHGDVPCVCINEVFGGPDIRAAGAATSWKEIVLLQMDLLFMYWKLYWETLHGVWLFTFEEYAPYEKLYGDTVGHYQRKVQELRTELERTSTLSADKDVNPLVGFARLALTHAKIWTYSAVPWVTQITVVLFVLLFLPFIMSATVLSNFVWRLWLQLFVAHHVYGLTADGILDSLREYISLVTSQKWKELQGRLITGLSALAFGGSCGTFFSLLPAMIFIFATVAFMVTLMCVWARLPLMLLLFCEEAEAERSVKLTPADVKNKQSDAKSKNGGGSEKTTATKGKRNLKKGPNDTEKCKS